MEIPIIDLEGSGVTEDEVITNFYGPENRSKSGWANGEYLAHKDWCQKEAALFIKRGRNVGIVKNTQGQLALFEKKEIK